MKNYSRLGIVSICFLAIIASLSCENPASTNVATPADTTAVPPAAPTKAPTVSYMKIGFDDRGDYPFATLPDVSLYRAFLIAIAEPERHQDIASIRITDPNGIYWEYSGSALQAYWEESRSRYAIWNRYMNTAPDSGALGSYTVTIAQEGLESATFSMDAYAGNDPASNTGAIYSNCGASTPKVLSRPTAVGASKSGSAITYTVAGIDPLVNYVYAWLYASDGTYLGVRTISESMADDDHATFEFTDDMSGSLDASTIDSIGSVVLLFLSERHLNDERMMMYRYTSEKIIF